MTRSPSVRSAAAAVLLFAAPTALRAQGTPPKDSATTQQDSTKKPKDPPKSSLNFSGWVFGNYQIETDQAAKAANGGQSPNKFDIGRAYLTFQAPAGDRASVRVTTDIKQGQTGSSSFYQGWFIRLKYAYLQYSVLQPTPTGASGFARVGIMQNMIIDHEESFWPRYLINTAIDRLSFFSSADLGAGTGWTFPHKLGEVYATLTNGSGYEAPETDRFKDFGARVSLTPFGQTPGLFNTFTISPWIYRGQLASKFAKDTLNPVTSGLDRNRWGIFVGNKDRRLTFGAEYAERTDGIESGATPLTRTVADQTGQLYDGFVIIRPLDFSNPQLTHSFGLIARYDHFKPNKDVDGYSKFVVAGLFWEPTAKTTLALDYQEATPESGLSGTQQKIWYVHWQAYF